MKQHGVELIIVRKVNSNELVKKYKDLIPYFVFGLLTTLVNIISYWVFAHPFHLPVMVSTIVAWVLSVFFAYVTNRKWVFHSDATGARDITREIASFFACRITTGIIDWGMMFGFVEIIGLNDLVIKIIANIVVVVLNYVASKFLIFKQKN